MLSIQNLNFLSDNNNNPPFDLARRRMSDSAAPAALYPPPPEQHSHCRYNNQFPSTAFAYNPSPRPFPQYSPHLHRGASTGSLRDLRHHHAEFSPQQWKQDIDPRHTFFHNRSAVYDEPISPLQPNFSGGLTGSPSSGIPYSPISENPYGPSPPGTGTSTSSSVAPLTNGSCIPCSPTLSISQHLQRSLSTPNMAAEAVDTKSYCFVALPGNAVKKRPRRRYDEIERLYQCSWPECTKAYGTLNHLNAHVTMQKHGPKRTPDEFKEMRKQWRKAKKEHCAPAPGIMRRESFGETYDDYNHHYVGQPTSHSLHQIPRSQVFQDELGLPTSVSIAGERYNIPIDDIRYPPSNGREDDEPGIGGGYPNGVPNRHRYSDGLPASWHGSSVLSRSNPVHHHHPHHQHHEHYEPASSVPQTAHHSQLPHLAIGAGMTRRQSPPPHSAPAHPHHHHHSTMSVNRGGGLPESGALLTTPLSGYHPDSSSLMPPIQNGSGPVNVIYTSEGYELYDSDSTGRPGTGHTNASVS